MSNADYQRFEENEIREIVQMALKGEKIQTISKKYRSSEKTIRTTLYKLGYRYDKRQKLWWNKSMKESMYIMNNVDIECEIGELSAKRYYDRYLQDYPENIGNEEKENLKIHKGLFKEIECIAGEYGCDYPEELIELILLRFLDINRKKDLTSEFRKRCFIEKGYDDKELKILMKYNDEDNIQAPAEDLFWEDDQSYPEVIELKEYYKKVLIEKNTNINNDEFGYLKNKYDSIKEREKENE